MAKKQLRARAPSRVYAKQIQIFGSIALLHMESRVSLRYGLVIRLELSPYMSPTKPFMNIYQQTQNYPKLRDHVWPHKWSCGPVFFTCAPTHRWDLLFNGENLVLVKLESLPILFYFKRENKIRKKTLKQSDSKVLEKYVLEKPESKSEYQVTY